MIRRFDGVRSRRSGAVLLVLVSAAVCVQTQSQSGMCGLNMYTAATGPWVTPSTWAPAGAQGVTASDAAFVVGGATVTIDAVAVAVDAFNVSYGALVLVNGGSLTIGAPVTSCRACASNPCQNGALCTNTGADAFACTCVSGFSGALCQTDVNECASTPCQNGATCVDGIGAYTCTCANGYNGVRCQTDVNDCASTPCRNGTCVDGIASYACSCYAGFSGTLCQTDVNECASLPCTNGATCIDLINGYRCVLPNCAAAGCDERRTTGCIDDPVTGPQCVCAPGFSGQMCETNSPIRITSLLPVSGAPDIRVDQLVIRLTFDHDVQVRRVDAATAVTDIPAVVVYQTNRRADVPAQRRCAVTASAGSSWLSTSGSRATITIPMGVINKAATRFYVVVQPNLFEDKTGQAFQGLTDTAGAASWNFTTVSALPDALTQDPNVAAQVQLCFTQPYSSVSTASDANWLQAAVATALNVDSTRIGLATFTDHDPSASSTTALTFTDTTFAQFQINAVTDPMLYSVEPSPQALARQLASLASLNSSISTVLSDWRWPLCPSSIATSQVSEPTDNTLLQTIIIAGALVLLFVLVVGVARWRTPSDRKVFGPISTLALAWVAAGFDLLLCSQLSSAGSTYSGHFTALVVLLSAGLVLNAVFAFWTLFHRASKSAEFNAWFGDTDGTNNKVMIALILTAMAFNIDCSEITNSYLFASAALNAPWSRADLMRFKVWGLVSVVVQDVPRLVIKIMYTTTVGDRTAITWLSLVVSCVATLWNALSRVAYVVQYRGATRLRASTAGGAAPTAKPTGADDRNRPPPNDRQTTPPTNSSAIHMSTVQVHAHDSHAPSNDRRPSSALSGEDLA